jgi:sugar lactone lactonase YvrE
MIKVVGMNIQSRVLLAGLLAAGVVSAYAQTKAAAPATAASARPADALTQKAETLTLEQIGESKDIAGLTRLSEVYNSIGDMPRFTRTVQRLTELLPDSGQLKLQLAMVYASQKDKTNAYDVLVRMQGQGYGYDLSKEPRFEPIHGTKVWDYVVANMQANAKQFGEGKVAFEMPKGDFLFESIGYDPARKQFLVGSAREGKVLLVDDKGKTTDFIAPNAENGLWGVFDLAVDAAHDKVYLASSDVAYYKGFDSAQFGQTGIFEFQLSSGKFLHKYLVTEAGKVHALTSITVGKDGRVYAADSARRQIFRIDHDQLSMLVENPKLTSIRGLAVSDDGRTLYMADYALGIFGIDLTKTAPFSLSRNPEKLVLGGIDGLYYYDGCLIVIESGMVPQRVMRLKLSDDGRSVVAAMPLDVAQPAFTTPTVGAIAGNDLYFIANSQKGLYDKLGVLKNSDALQATRIFRSNLRFAWDQTGISTGVQELKKASGVPLPPSPPSPLKPVDKPEDADSGGH